MPTKDYKQPRLCDSWYTILQRLSCYIFSYSEKGWNLRRCPKPDNPKIPLPSPMQYCIGNVTGVEDQTQLIVQSIPPNLLTSAFRSLEGHVPPEAVVMFSIWCKHWLWFWILYEYEYMNMNMWTWITTFHVLNTRHQGRF